VSGPGLAAIIFLVALFLAVVGATAFFVVSRGGVATQHRHRDEDQPPKP
jgi:hypothetical protein